MLLTTFFALVVIERKVPVVEKVPVPKPFPVEHPVPVPFPQTQVVERPGTLPKMRHHVNIINLSHRRIILASAYIEFSNDIIILETD